MYREIHSTKKKLLALLEAFYRNNWGAANLKVGSLPTLSCIFIKFDCKSEEKHFFSSVPG